MGSKFLINYLRQKWCDLQSLFVAPRLGCACAQPSCGLSVIILDKPKDATLFIKRLWGTFIVSINHVYLTTGIQFFSPYLGELGISKSWYTHCFRTHILLTASLRLTIGNNIRHNKRYKGVKAKNLHVYRRIFIIFSFVVLVSDGRYWCYHMVKISPSWRIVYE